MACKTGCPGCEPFGKHSKLKAAAIGLLLGIDLGLLIGGERIAFHFAWLWN